MSLKTIKVNPIFLMGAGKGGGSGGSGTSAKNKTRREKPIGVSLGQPNNIKKKLIARIKNFQQGGGIKINNNNNTNAPTNATETFVDEFSQSVDFLNNLARDKQEDKATAKRNKTLKKPRISNPDAYMHVATELPPELLGGLTPIITPSVAANTVALSGANTVALSGANTVAPLGANTVAPSAATPPLWSAPPPPSYSNLKMGGTKPTYRTWLRNTQKNKPAVPSAKPSISILEDLMPVVSETAGLVPVVSETAALAPTAFAPVLSKTAAFAPVLSKTAAFAPVLSETAAFAPTAFAPTAFAPTAFAPTAFAPTAFAPAPIYTPSLKPKRKKITRTLKYKLGKHANGKVSVLIKNNQTRRKVQTEHAQLKLKSIIDIKNHLRSNNLLKVGSEAPNDVLRHLYEQSILAGQIENKAKDTLIHNYFNTEK
jgi:hypothetical protein